MSVRKAFAGLFALAAIPVSVMAQDSPLQGDLGVVLSQPLAFEAPKVNSGSAISARFQDGKQVPTPVLNLPDPEKEPTTCTLTIRLANEEFFEMLDEGAYPELVIPAGALTLTQTAVFASSPLGSDGKLNFRILAVDFGVNTTTENGYVEARGVKLMRRNGALTESKLVQISCSGTDLRVSDLQKTLGSSVSSVSAIQ